MRKTLLLLFFMVSLQGIQAQKTIVFKEFRYAAPVNYLADETLRLQFISQLNGLLLKHRNMRLADTTNVVMRDMTRDADKTQTQADKRDTSMEHLYLSVIEIYPRSYFDALNDPADSALRKTAKTVFRVLAQLVKSERTLVISDTLDIVVNHIRGSGIGNESSLVLLLPKTFVELMRTALNTLLDPKHDIVQMALGVTPAYIIDNYISPAVAGKPRTYATMVKNLSQYNYAEQKQMLRMDEPVYQEIMIRGKKAQKYNDTLTNAIRSTSNYGSSDFVFLQQEWRDVLNDKNYLIKLVTQVDPAKVYATSDLMFTNFLAGSLHFLISDKDTIASFSILRQVPGPGLKQYPGKVYNGMDIASAITVNNLNKVWDVSYDYLVDGNILGREFKIFFGGPGNKVKEIYLDGKLICIAQGKFSPDAFVVFDATLSPVLFNQLLIIAFNRFME